MHNVEITPTVLVSSLALLISIATFFMSRYYQSNDRKKALTIEMWKTWESSELRNQRVLSWKSVANKTDSSVPPKSSIKADSLNTDTTRAFNDVELFLEGLGKLKQSGQLDNKLFDSLFEPNLSVWKKISLSVERLGDNNLRSSARLQILFDRFL